MSKLFTNSFSLLFIMAILFSVLVGCSDNEETVLSSKTSSLTETSSTPLSKKEYVLDKEYNSAIADAKDEDEKLQIAEKYTKKWSDKITSNYYYLKKHYEKKGDSNGVETVKTEYAENQKKLQKQLVLAEKAVIKNQKNFDFSVAETRMKVYRNWAVKYYEKCVSLSITPEEL